MLYQAEISFCLDEIGYNLVFSVTGVTARVAGAPLAGVLIDRFRGGEDGSGLGRDRSWLNGVDEETSDMGIVGNRHGVCIVDDELRWLEDQC